MARVIFALLALVAVASAQQPQQYSYADADTVCATPTSYSDTLTTVTGSVDCDEAAASPATGGGVAGTPWIFYKVVATQPTVADCSTFQLVVTQYNVIANAKPADADGCTVGTGITVRGEPVTVKPETGCVTINGKNVKLVCPDTSSFHVYSSTPAEGLTCADDTGSSSFGAGLTATPKVSTCLPVPGVVGAGAGSLYFQITLTPSAGVAGTGSPNTCASGSTGNVAFFKDDKCATAATGTGSSQFTIGAENAEAKPKAGRYSSCLGYIASDPVGVSNFRVSCASASSSSCFSAGSKVTVEDGSEVAIEDVEIGQRVLAVDKFGKTFYDRVFRITHHDHVSTINYVRLTTSEGSVLELSGNHYLHVNACCDLNNVALADDVKVGDTVFVMKAGSETAAPVAVTKKENVLKQGAFNVHVLNGNIVVNGVVATHFTTESAWQNNNAATAWYHVQDAVYRVTGMAPRPE